MQEAASEGIESGRIDFEQFENASTDVLNHPLKDDHRFKCELYESDGTANKALWETDARATLPVRAL